MDNKILEEENLEAVEGGVAAIVKCKQRNYAKTGIQKEIRRREAYESLLLDERDDSNSALRRFKRS